MSFMLDDVGLTHSNGFTALSHISLSAIQGESIALIGPSGAGKTSLLSTIGTAYLPTAGRMQVLGRTAAAQSAARAKGAERFEGFMQTLGKRLATGDRFLKELSRDLDSLDDDPLPDESEINDSQE